MKQHLAGLCALLVAGIAPAAHASTSAPASEAAPDRPASAPLYLVAGSYAPAAEEGIRIFRFDEATGEATPAGGCAGIADPSYLVASADGGSLYAVSETGDETAALVRLAFDRRSGTLRQGERQPTRGAAPCFVALDPAGRFAATANYSGGSISLFALDSAGRLAAPARVVRFAGRGVDPERQEQPHLHCIAFTPDGRRLLACDLGLDRIHTVPLVAGARGTEAVDTAGEQSVALRPVSGPRHLRFGPDGRFAYLVNELSGQVTVFAHRRGRLRPVQHIAADTTGARASGDIRISPDGRHLYASNRLKNDGLAIFAVDARRGTLRPLGYQPTGPHPRNFALSPDGRFLLVACRDSDTIEIYARDAATGLLRDTGRRIAMPRPVCLEFVK